MKGGDVGRLSDKAHPALLTDDDVAKVLAHLAVHSRKDTGVLIDPTLLAHLLTQVALCKALVWLGVGSNRSVLLSYDAEGNRVETLWRVLAEARWQELRAAVGLCEKEETE